MIVGVDVPNRPLNHLTILVPVVNVLAVYAPLEVVEKLARREDDFVCCLEVHNFGARLVVVEEFLWEETEVDCG